MAFGSYTLIREDENGVPLDEPLEVAEDEYPDLGHTVDWDDGLSYRVYDVRHRRDPDERSDDRVTLHCHVFARRVVSSAKLRKATPGEEGGLIPLRVPSGTDGAVSSDILPTGLLSVLVLAGYDTLKIQLRNAKRDNAQMLRATGRGTWILVKQAWMLSRRAKRYRNELAMFISESWPAAGVPNGEVALPFVHTSSQELAPSPPPTRPVLRLV